MVSISGFLAMDFFGCILPLFPSKNELIKGLYEGGFIIWNPLIGSDLTGHRDMNIQNSMSDVLRLYSR